MHAPLSVSMKNEVKEPNQLYLDSQYTFGYELFSCIWHFAFCVFLFFFLFFFFPFLMHAFLFLGDKVHCSCTVHILFTHCSRDSQPLYLEKKYIKNESHSTIHTFKNYFATVFSISNQITIATHPNLQQVYVLTCD